MAALKKINTLAELRDQVLDTIQLVRGDPRTALQAHEIGNLAGKTVAMCKVHLERCALNKVKSDGDWDRFISMPN